MLGETNLDAARYPELRFESSRVRAAGDTLFVSGALTIRDRTRAIVVPIIAAEEGDRIRMRGAVDIRQSDFGIRPESIAGVVKVADVVNLNLALVGSVSGRTCD